MRNLAKYNRVYIEKLEHKNILRNIKFKRKSAQIAVNLL